ncbi:MAG: polyketide synthase dehydratase domain-containing protein, partial [Pseudomonadota bacterium]
RRAALLLRDDLANGGSVVLHSLPEGSSDWVEHAKAVVDQNLPPRATPIFPGYLRDVEPRQPDTFYQCCAGRGLNYGPGFQGLQSVHVGDGEALGHIRLPDICAASAKNHILHPALLDSALQVSLALDEDGETVVPVALQEMSFLLAPEEPVTEILVHVRRTEELTCDISLFLPDERPLAALDGLRLEPLALGADELGEELVHRLEFQTAARPDDSGNAPGTWLVHGVGAGAIADALIQAGAKADSAVALSEDHTGIAYVAPPRDVGLEVQKTAMMDLARLVQAAQGLGSAPKVAILTTDAQAQIFGEIADPGAGLFWGFARVLRREHPELEPMIVDSVGAEPAELAAELLAWSGDDQVVLGADGARSVARLVKGEAQADEQAQHSWSTPLQPSRLVSSKPGYFDGLEYRPLRRAAPGGGEVEVEISAAALNFIDVMKAMGTYPGLDPRTARLGGEFAGKVVAIGDGVEGVAPGDRVVGCGFGAFATHATVPAAHVQPIPEAMADADAAALPLVMTTAWYGLIDLADLTAGETVLIHSAAGGLGLAAIQVAKMQGATIIATAGSEEKREMLRGMGIEHVFNSRDLSWAEGVKAATNDRGVDVVLNSLTGMAIQLGLEALAPDGRFIEVGKKDIYGGRSISLGAFRNRLSISSVDIAGLMEKRVARFGRLLGDVWDAVTDGKLTPLPILPYRFADAADALRTMGKAITLANSC